MFHFTLNTFLPITTVVMYVNIQKSSLRHAIKHWIQNKHGMHYFVNSYKKTSRIIACTNHITDKHHSAKKKKKKKWCQTDSNAQRLPESREGHVEGWIMGVGWRWRWGRGTVKRMMGWKLIHSRMATREHFFYRNPKLEMREKGLLLLSFELKHHHDTHCFTWVTSH